MPTPPTAPTPLKVARTRIVPLAVFAVAVLAGMNAIHESPVGVFYDDALYVILGKALAIGDGYRYLNIPGAPPATHYPPAYPALLAILWRISPSFPENVVLFKTVNAVLLGLVALGAYYLGRARLEMSALRAAFAALAGTITIPPLVLSSGLLSETLFLALLLPVLVLAERTTERDGVRQAAMIGAAAGGLCLVRSHAIALIAAIAVAYLLRRRYREAGVATAAGLALLLPWLLWVRANDALIPAAIAGQYGSYTAWFVHGLRANGAGMLLPTVGDNLATTYAVVARSFSVAPNALLDGVAVLAVGTLVCSGAVSLARRARVSLLFLAAYFVMVIVWPFSPLRFIWGVWPLLALLLVEGALHAWRLSVTNRVTRVTRTVCAAASIVVLLGATLFNALGYRNAWWATTSRSLGPRIQAHVSWVLGNVAPSQVIASSDEGAVYLYTGRHAVPTNSFRAERYLVPASALESAADLAQIVRAFKPDYVLAWTVPAQDAAARLSEQRPPLIIRVDTMPGGRVYSRPGVTRVTRKFSQP